MAISITDITKICAGNHWEYTVTKTGVGSRTFVLHESAIDEFLEQVARVFPADISDLPAGLQADLITIFLWGLWSVKRNGKTKAQITNVDLETLS